MIKRLQLIDSNKFHSIWQSKLYWQNCPVYSSHLCLLQSHPPPKGSRISRIDIAMEIFSGAKTRRNLKFVSRIWKNWKYQTTERPILKLSKLSERNGSLLTYISVENRIEKIKIHCECLHPIISIFFHLFVIFILFKKKYEEFYLESKEKPKRLGKKTRWVFRKKQANRGVVPEFMRDHNKKIINVKKIANHLHDNFTKVGPNLAPVMLDNDNFVNSYRKIVRHSLYNRYLWGKYLN